MAVVAELPGNGCCVPPAIGYEAVRVEHSNQSLKSTKQN